MAKMGKVRPATLKEDDAAICELAKLSRYTKDFATLNYIREDIDRLYAKSFVGLCREGKTWVGFVYVRHLVIKNRPYSVIHYLGVAPRYAGQGVARRLVEWALATSPHGVLRLGVEERNEDAWRCYMKLGFKEIARTTVGGAKNPRAYIKMELLRENYVPKAG